MMVPDEKNEQDCGIIVLAAGASLRLGRPKQLLPYNRTTLLLNTIKTALASSASAVVVILGAAAGLVKPDLTHQKLFFVINEQWEEGMASSIRRGLNFLLQARPAADSALFLACDQPHLSTGLLNKLINLQKETGRHIAASHYAGTAGIPAAFSKAMFSALLALTGDMGAKKLIMQQPDQLVTIPFEQGAVDIDTEADYLKLISKQTD